MLKELPQTRNGERVYEYAFPQRISWANAEEHKLVLDNADVADWLRQNRNIVRSVTLRELPTGDIAVTVRWLESVCPCCGDRKRPLQHDRWVFVPDWENKGDVYPISDEALEQKDLTGNPAFETQQSDDGNDPSKYFLVYDGRIPLKSRDHFEPLRCNALAPQPYGSCSSANPIDAALAELRQTRFNGEGFPPFEIHFGNRERFAGTYHCPSCGNYFSVEFGTFRKGKVDYELFANHEEDYGPLPTQPVRLTRTKDSLRIDAAFGSARVSVEFNFLTGMTFLDDAPMLKSQKSSSGLFSLPITGTGKSFFDNEEFLLQASVLFPRAALPMRGWFYQGAFPALILANRFRGYPKDFYIEAEDALFGRDNRVLQTISELPMRYADIEGLYWKTGLPQKKSLRKVLFENPMLFAYAMTCPLLPFQNVDILTRMFTSDRAIDYMRLFEDEEVARAWWLMAKAKGEAAVFKFLEKMPYGKAFPPANPIEHYWIRGGFNLSDVVVEKLRHRSIKDGFKEIRYLVWESNNPGIALESAFEYSDLDRRYEGGVNGYTFRLVKNPHELVTAAIELRNCLEGYGRTIPSEALVVLVRAGEKIVAAIEIKQGEVWQARAWGNKPITEYPKIEHAFNVWKAKVRIECVDM